MKHIEMKARKEGDDTMLNFEKGAAPLYTQLETLLRKKIEQEEYEKGDLLPTEKELMEEYQVSRVTVRQAIGLLAQMGYVKSQRGIGTEVIYDKIDEQIHKVISFTEEMEKHNITMETSYCNMEKVYPEKMVAKSLEIPLKEECYCLKRVRDVNGKPLVYTITYLKDIVNLPLDDQYYTKSLYQYLKEKHQIIIASGEDTFEAALPSKKVQELLQIEENVPVIVRTRKTFLQNGEVFEYSKCYYAGNRYKYTVKL